MSDDGPPVESERRRGSFRPGVPIVLCDGAAWTLPQPRVEGAYMVPTAGGDREVALSVTDFGAEYDFRVEDAIIDNLNNDLKDAQLYWFARYLLRVNYDLTDRDFYYLLRFKRDDPDNARMWIDIFILATSSMVVGSDDPKAPTAAGPDSPNGPATPARSAASTPAAARSPRSTASR